MAVEDLLAANSLVGGDTATEANCEATLLKVMHTSGRDVGLKTPLLSGSPEQLG
jgi:hypothetical protein